MCSNVSHFQHPDEADYFTLQVGKILDPVVKFIGSWFDATLVRVLLTLFSHYNPGFQESTWPEIERTMIQNLINDEAKGVGILEANVTYKRIINRIHEDMLSIGHSE